MKQQFIPRIIIGLSKIVPLTFFKSSNAEEWIDPINLNAEADFFPFFFIKLQILKKKNPHALILCMGHKCKTVYQFSAGLDLVDYH